MSIFNDINEIKSKKKNLGGGGGGGGVGGGGGKVNRPLYINAI